MLSIQTKFRQYQVLVRIESNQSTHTFLVDMEITLGKVLVLSYRTKYTPALQLTIILLYIFPREIKKYIPKKKTYAHS
jgi:hypothetical protein